MALVLMLMDSLIRDFSLKTVVKAFTSLVRLFEAFCQFEHNLEFKGTSESIQCF